MRKTKSFILLLFIIAMLSLKTTAASDEACAAADKLNALGLFYGVGTNYDGTINYDLDRAPTRNEAITMLVRLLGKEDEARSGNWDIPFTDVADWAKPYVGYAYANGLTSGTDETTFDGDKPVTAAQYLTFVLRALNYSSEVDFKWDTAWELSDRLGITDGRYTAYNNSDFLRADVAIVSVGAIDTPIKCEGRTLAQRTNGEPKEENIIYEDKWVKIKYEDSMSYTYFENHFTFRVNFSVAYKGGRFIDGRTYPKIMVVNKCISLDGSMPWVFYGDDSSSICVVSEGCTNRLTVSGSLRSTSSPEDFFKTLSAQFTVYYGFHEKDDFSIDTSTNSWYEAPYTEFGEFQKFGKTDVYVSPINLANEEISTVCPEIINEETETVLKYSDANLSVYTYVEQIGVYYQNKTGKVMTLRLEEVSLDSVVCDWANFGSGLKQIEILPYSTVDTGIYSDAQNIADANIKFTVTIDGKSYVAQINN